jgi:hypothetical protein
MVRLNLPEFECKIQNSEGKTLIFDQIRKKYVVLTPEEWVRQHVIHFFTEHLKYPRSLIKVEGGMSYNSLRKRSDIVVFDRGGNCFIVVECKSFSEKINQKTILQASSYFKTKNSRFLIATNGLDHFCFMRNKETGLLELMKEFPAFESTIS